LTANDLYLRALPNLASAVQQRVREALDLLSQAIARDPIYVPALALAAMCIQQLHVNTLADSPRAMRAQGIDYARRALSASDSDPLVLASAAFVLAHFGEDIDAAMALMDRALPANPGFAYGWQLSGVLRLYDGELDTAIEHVERSLRLNSCDRVIAPLTAIGGAYFFQREFDTAAAKLQASIQERPGFAMSYRMLAASYAHMGRLDEAREVVERLRLLTPVIVPPFVPIRNRNTASCFFPACAWRPARQPDPEARDLNQPRVDSMPDHLFTDRDALASLCRRRHIRRLSLFGSVLKGNARPDSDVDLLVEFSRGAKPSLLDLADIEQELSALLAERRVDLRTAEDLSRYFRDEVLREAEVQYESA
jgi:predicted nucleotidyltransferase/Tfp pilus assembly protein PilF